MRLLNEFKLNCNIEEIANYDLENNNIFGSSYLVWQRDSVVLKKHFGYADAEKCLKTNDDTIYRLASMTKPVTAVAILILFDRGLVSLDDPIYKYIPGFEDIHIITPDGADLGKPKSPVTIFHCLTHTSGFGSEKIVSMSPDDRKTISDTVSCYIKAGLDFEPFSKQMYSGIAAFDVLAAVVEKVTDTDYEEFLKKEIFIPCNMTDTIFSPSENQWKRFAAIHSKKDGISAEGKTFEGCVFGEYPAEHKLGGAGLAATLDDYGAFAGMLLKKGVAENQRILSMQAFNMLSSPHVPFEIMPQNERWGLGVRVITERAYKYLPVGAFGWSGAYGSHFWVDPENEIFAVFMKNSEFDGGAGNMSAQRFEKAVFRALD